MRSWYLILLFSCSLLSCNEKEDTALHEDTDADSDSDADADADTDTDTDTDSDADADLWTDCPDSSSFVGESSWEGLMEAGTGATWCGTFNEMRTLEKELQAKTLFHLPQGSYPLPTVSGSYSLRLPVCTLRADQETSPAISDTGDVTVTSTDFAGTTYYSLSATQAMHSADKQRWTLGTAIRLAGKVGGPPETLPLDGGPVDEDSGAGLTFELAIEGTHPYSPDVIFSAPCSWDGWTLNTHRVEFVGGEITLNLQIGASMAATEPGAFVHAEGVIDGVAFTQDNYFNLIYRPEHHHFVRHFAVILDAPIEKACAIRVESLEPMDKSPNITVSLAGCDLAPLESRKVTMVEYNHGSD